MDKIDINAWQCMTAYRLQYIYILPFGNLL
jgi:hypothetical protein